MMQLDDSKYKVYIYNLEDELSSESEAEDGRLVFLPDIEKHMRTNRLVPQYMLSEKPDPDLASKQLVLYSVPSSITVPEDRDSVRKAIIEARQRAREKQRAELQGSGPMSAAMPGTPVYPPGVTSSLPPSMAPQAAGFPGGGPFPSQPPAECDADAMELD